VGSQARSFGQRAESYLAAVREGSQDKIQTAVNASFGELFSIGGGDAPQWAEVAQCRGEYAKGELPRGVRFLAMTVDVQKSRIFFVIRGWGARGTSWLIDYGMLYGETIEEGIWTDLADLISAPVCGRPVQLVLIDSGFRPGRLDELPLNRIYDFCRRFPRVRPTKGSSAPMRVPLIKADIEATVQGSALKAGLKLLRLDTDYFKARVFERIRWPHDQPGAWHLPHDASEDYCRQIVSEARVRLASGRVKWVRRSKENHFLDLEAMQCAAAHLINAGRIPAEGGVARASQPAASMQPSNVVPEEIDQETPAMADEIFREQPMGPHGQRHPVVPPAFDDQPSWLYPNGRRGSFWGR
jgi:phage terminase large subunit GpA-like protein